MDITMILFTTALLLATLTNACQLFAANFSAVTFLPNSVCVLSDAVVLRVDTEIFGSKTFIDCQGHSIETYNSLSIWNLTFFNCSSLSAPVLNLTQVHFQMCGTVKSSLTLLLHQCIFDSSSSNGTGGAVNASTVRVVNSLFNNCTGELGGAIFAQDIQLVINSTFKNCYAKGGGAMFETVSRANLTTIANSTFLNCSVLFGDAAFKIMG